MLCAGIVGLPNVGKSTLFNALTATQAAQAANFPFCTIEPNLDIGFEARFVFAAERFDRLDGFDIYAAHQRASSICARETSSSAFCMAALTGFHLPFIEQFTECEQHSSSLPTQEVSWTGPSSAVMTEAMVISLGWRESL